jgi:elongator complex protein 3
VDVQNWEKKRQYSADQIILARHVLAEIQNGMDVKEAVRKNPLPEGGYIGKHLLVSVYRDLVEKGEQPADSELLARIRLKPVRTLSGVTTVTVLTKPYPCPGECIFCPTDVRMPKSYLPDEPGAMRALQHDFEPYNQVSARIAALEAVGHPTEKIELLILGGTWSAYRRDYQEWFVQRCLDALNQTDSPDLGGAQRYNETAVHRNVGLVVETRPDHIDKSELVWMRTLGVTKVQMGVQSLDNRILDINRRGHNGDQTGRAVNLLRAAGFKIVLHWMPNLLGASIESDRKDFSHLWQGICPDEIKIYPTQLLENADLYDYWQRGEYAPYSTEELIELVADIKETIPHYCRVNRVVRDIPSTNVVEGNKRTSLRQDIKLEMEKRGTSCNCVRCREVRGVKVNSSDLKLDDLIYLTDISEEHFLSYKTGSDRLAGFLRLTLPGKDSPNTGMVDLENAAIIREVHVYGQSLPVGAEAHGAAQHIGTGTRLIKQSEKIAKEKGFNRLAVISAIGTRHYYEKRGFNRGELYLVKTLEE